MIILKPFVFALVISFVVFILGPLTLFMYMANMLNKGIIGFKRDFKIGRKRHLHK